MAFYEHTFQIGLRDVGISNEITNKAILGYFEDIGGLHSDEVGYGLKNIEQTHLTWILLHWKMQVLKRVKYGEKIMIKTWSRYSQKFYSYRDYEMYNESGELVVIATSKWALIHIDKGLTKIDEELINQYKPDSKSVFHTLEVEKIKEPSTFSNRYACTVLRSYIDVNHHMHNLCYLDLAYEALPEAVYLHTNFSYVEIMYKKEAKLGDELICLYEQIENTHYITIKSKDEKQLHAIVKLQ
ncbi:MAG: acyl-[acyl-carrier-protein] thioesterase [Clostridia bacterium]